VLDHIYLNVSNYKRSRRFYRKALAPLGVSLVFEREPNTAAFGSEGRPQFFITDQRTPITENLHIAFSSPDRERVDAFHLAALEAGGTDNGGPGVREIYHPSYYGAFVLDPDGNNVEAVCFSE
jgi:catechol 2,3-dioxygenase-like lactoylglutathione lyase family enzyme